MPKNNITEKIISGNTAKTKTRLAIAASPLITGLFTSLSLTIIDMLLMWFIASKILRHYLALVPNLEY